MVCLFHLFLYSFLDRKISVAVQDDSVLCCKDYWTQQQSWNESDVRFSQRWLWVGGHTVKWLVPTLPRTCCLFCFELTCEMSVRTARLHGATSRKTVIFRIWIECLNRLLKGWIKECKKLYIFAELFQLSISLSAVYFRNFQNILLLHYLMITYEWLNGFIEGMSDIFERWIRR
jgi:hypothetical protein